MNEPIFLELRHPFSDSRFTNSAVVSNGLMTVKKLTCIGICIVGKHDQDEFGRASVVTLIRSPAHRLKAH